MLPFGCYLLLSDDRCPAGSLSAAYVSMGDHFCLVGTWTTGKPKIFGFTNSGPRNWFYQKPKTENQFFLDIARIGLVLSTNGFFVAIRPIDRFSVEIRLINWFFVEIRLLVFHGKFVSSIFLVFRFRVAL